MLFTNFKYVSSGSEDGEFDHDQQMTDAAKSGEEDSEEEDSDDGEGEEDEDGSEQDDNNDNSSEGGDPVEENSNYKEGKISNNSDVSSDNESEESEEFYNFSAKDEEATKERLSSLNENALDLFVSKPITDGSRNYHIVSFGDTIWYNPPRNTKINLETIFESRGGRVPFYVEHLDEHKLRVEYNINNEMVVPKGKSYPKTRWMTVVRTSRINPEEELVSELKKLTKHFKALHSAKLRPSPGQRWMTYSLNTGNSRVIDTCRGYMGNDDDIMVDRINSELIDLGNKPHRYNMNEHLDKFLPDYYIKRFLQDFLNAVSWDSVSDDIKKVCYKGRSNRNFVMPDWNKMNL